MLDLRAKLLQAGFVTKEQVNKVEEERLAKKNRAKSRKIPLPRSSKGEHAQDYEAVQRVKQLEKLKSLPKNEQYDLVRRWVERNRLDKATITITEKSERYFFEKEDSNVHWLTLDPTTTEAVNNGRAAIMAFMSHHGLAHCVIPRDIAEDVRAVFPLWIRVLKDPTI